MPVLSEYIRSITNDFLNGKVNSEDLSREIAASNITIALSHINTLGDNVSIWFKDSLTAAQELTLTAICNGHTGLDYVAPPDLVRITEESIGTGGNFASDTCHITAAANSIGTGTKYWPYPTSCLVVKFTTTEEQIGDKLNMCIGKDTIIGVLPSDISSLASAWVSQNYLIGDKVTYNHPIFGSEIYTCIANTISSEPPTNKSHWQHGFQIPLTTTTAGYVNLGYYIKITDGTNTDDLGRVIHKTTNSIFTENAPSNTYLAVTPTYVKMTVKVLKDFEIHHARQYIIGESKLGGSAIPAKTIVCIEYENNHNTDVEFVGEVEYLY